MLLANIGAEKKFLKKRGSHDTATDPHRSFLGDSGAPLPVGEF